MSHLSSVTSQQKYGLVMPMKKPVAQKKQVVLKKRSSLGAFNDEDEDNDDNDNDKEKIVGGYRDVERVNRQLLAKPSTSSLADTARMHNKALEEDPNVFDYDGSYDAFKASVVESHPLSRDATMAPPVS